LLESILLPLNSSAQTNCHPEPEEELEALEDELDEELDELDELEEVEEELDEEPEGAPPELELDGPELQAAVNTHNSGKR
jgi:acetylornithine deacetylase/succinyl-diaminopimelate desuccinylase-like protein